MTLTVDRLTATIRATFSIDFALNIAGEIIPRTRNLLPLGGSQLSQAGLLVSVLFILFEIHDAVGHFKKT